jgi:hypothetical protein
MRLIKTSATSPNAKLSLPFRHGVPETAVEGIFSIEGGRAGRNVV